MSDTTPTKHPYEVIKPFQWRETQFATGDSFVPAEQGCSAYKLEVLQYSRHLSESPVSEGKSRQRADSKGKPNSRGKRKHLAKREQERDSEEPDSDSEAPASESDA